MSENTVASGQQDVVKVPHVFVAMNAVATDLARIGVSKDQRNKAQSYNFRGIDDLYNVLAPLLAKHKLLIIPRVTARTETERKTKSDGTMYAVALNVSYHLRSAVDGSWVDGSTFGEAADTADKATNKAMSAAFKYFVIQTFSIPIVGSDDPDLESPGADEEDEKPRSGKKATPVAEKPQTKGATLGELRAFITNLGEERGAKLTAVILKFYAISKLEDLAPAKIADAITKAQTFIAKNAAKPAAPASEPEKQEVDSDLPV